MRKIGVPISIILRYLLTIWFYLHLGIIVFQQVRSNLRCTEAAELKPCRFFFLVFLFVMAISKVAQFSWFTLIARHRMDPFLFVNIRNFWMESRVIQKQSYHGFQNKVASRRTTWQMNWQERKQNLLNPIHYRGHMNSDCLCQTEYFPVFLLGDSVALTWRGYVHDCQI